jgi:hypothetical protein
VAFEIICKRYNHSSPAITMRYLGNQDREAHEVLMNEIGEGNPSTRQKFFQNRFQKRIPKIKR